MAKTLVTDAPATALLTQAEINDEWFDEFQIGDKFNGIGRIVSVMIIYILLHLNTSEASRVLVIPIEILKSLHNRRYGFDHILHVALSHFDRRVTIPIASMNLTLDGEFPFTRLPWKRFQQRIYFEKITDGNNTNIYVYNLTDTGADLEEVGLDLAPFKDAMHGLLDAILQERSAVKAREAHGIELVAPLATTFVGSSSLTDWYDKKLPNSNVILSIKTLDDLYAFEAPQEQERPWRW